MVEYPECIRCGICCKSGACRIEFEREDGFCPHLKRLTNGKYECTALTSNLLKPRDIGIGSGCILRAIPEIYEYYLQQFKE